MVVDGLMCFLTESIGDGFNKHRGLISPGDGFVGLVLMCLVFDLTADGS